MQKNKFVNESIKGSCRNTAKRFIAMGLSIMVPFAGLKGEFCSAQNITKTTTTTTTTRPKGDVHEDNFTTELVSQNQLDDLATIIREGDLYMIDGFGVDGAAIYRNRLKIFKSQQDIRRSRLQGDNTNPQNTVNQPGNAGIHNVQEGTIYRFGGLDITGYRLIEMAEYIDREIRDNLYLERDREGDTFQCWLCWGLTLLCSLFVAPFIVMASK